MRIFMMIVMIAAAAACKEQPVTPNSTVTVKGEPIFPQGNRAPTQNFTGTVWLNNLVPADSVFNCVVASVTFEPGARTNWHNHPGGQILLVTEGEGYLQEKGGSRQTIRKGDVVKCMPGVEHWHGATPTTSLTHVVIMTKPGQGTVNWLQPVPDSTYNKQ